MQTTPRRVFLSYAQDDGLAFATDLSVQLSLAGHLPWRDKEQLTSQGGVRWVHELTRQLLSADVVVVILTPRAYASQYVEGEWMKALDHGLPVVPAMFLDCGVPLPLAPLQYVDFRSDPASGFTALLDRLALLDRPAAVTERDRQTLQALRALRERAAGSRKEELDGLIRELAGRIETHPEDIKAQTDRVERGLVEEKARAATEAERPHGPGVRTHPKRPPTQLDAFRDRVDQQTAIANALFEPKARMVTLLGRGGIGKTALACYVLHRLEAGELAAAGAPLQGIAYVQHTPTHPITLDRVLRYIAKVLPDDIAAKAERVFGNRDLSSEDRVDRFLDLINDGPVIALPGQLRGSPRRRVGFTPARSVVAVESVADSHAARCVRQRAGVHREAESLMMRLGLERAAHAPRAAAEAAVRDDHAGVVRALLQAAEEWTTCGDLFPGNELARRAGQIARRHELDDLAAQADALVNRLNARLELPEPEA